MANKLIAKPIRMGRMKRSSKIRTNTLLKKGCPKQDNHTQDRSGKLDEILTILKSIQIQMNETRIAISETQSAISDIQKRMNHVESSTEKMDSHIDFIEKIYDIVRNPLSSALGYYYKGNAIEKKQLPQMKQGLLKE